MNNWQIYVSTITGVIAVLVSIGTLYYTRRKYEDNTVVSVFLKDNNLFGIKRNGNQSQLTFSNSDDCHSELVNKNEVALLRSFIDEDKNFKYYKLLLINIRTLKEKTLIDQKLEKDGRDNSFFILSPSNLKISNDSKKILFVIEKYATGSTLIMVDIKSGKAREIFSAEKFEIITSGKFKGQYLAGVSEVVAHGRGIYYHIVDEKGNRLRSFRDEDEFMAFRGSLKLA